MKKLLNISLLLICLLLGFGLAKAWTPFAKWWNKRGFEHSEPTLITGVGDAPRHRGFTLTAPPPDAGKLFEEWAKLWATAVGIEYNEKWTPETIATTVKAAHARNMKVTLLPPPIFTATNPYPRPLAQIAADAQRAKVDRLCVSWLEKAPDPSYWEGEITAARAAFSGGIVFTCTDSIAPAVTCWNLADYMGITGAISLPKRLPHASDVVTFHDMRKAWESRLHSLESLSRSVGKPLALLTVDVPVAFAFKLPLPGATPGTPPENPKLQAMVYEALLAETKGRAADTDTFLLKWGVAGNRDAANGVMGLLPKITEAWDPKKPRTPETAPDEFSDAMDDLGTVPIDQL